MSRSVSYPNNASVVCYIDVSYMEDSDEWNDFMDSLKYVILTKYKSFEDDDHYIGRELTSVLSNQHAQIVVSEYCGLASVSLAPIEFDGYGEDSSLQNIANAWCNLVSDNFKKLIDKHFNSLNKVATFSNGESMYEYAS